MLLTRLLNACYPLAGFVYDHARLDRDQTRIEVRVRPRLGSRGRCSGCQQAAPGYDQLGERRFHFIPLWGYGVELVYRMRRVACPACGVKVESVPWAEGKQTLCEPYVHFLAHWARKLSWKETAQAFKTSWDQVHAAVEQVVRWGLTQRTLGRVKAIGVDEIQYPGLSN
jgi:transposase